MPNEPRQSDKPIRLSGHARENAAFRGTTEEEIVKCIREGSWGPAERGRLESRMEFPYDAEWNGRHYAFKRVRPIFDDGPVEIAVVTVYVYYF